MSDTMINFELLRRVRDHILEEPRRYDQRVVGTPSQDAPCGTAGCILGWAAVLSGEITDKELATVGVCVEDDLYNRTLGQLGLDDDEATIVIGRRGDLWPERFREPFRAALEAKDKAGQARAAADYIDWIIRTGKVTD